MVKIKINYIKCVEDPYKICVELCPVSIFQNEKLEKPKVVNEEKCILCRTCQVNCPNQAIEIFT
jgi:2-oxoglutarate ferredoxin oxidoreductase subunit delta